MSVVACIIGGVKSEHPYNISYVKRGLHCIFM